MTTDVPAGDLPDDALVELAAELFVEMDRAESGQGSRTPDNLDNCQ